MKKKVSKKVVKKKKKLSPLERAIASRRHSIKKLQAKKTRLRAETEEQCKEIDREIRSRRVILHALERGELRL